MQTPEGMIEDLVRDSPSEWDWHQLEELEVFLTRWEASIRADEQAKVLAGFTEWFAPGFTYPNGRTVPIGRETVAREFAAADARDMASPEDDTPTLVVRRLVGPWEPTDPIERETDERCDEQPCCRYCGEPGNDCPGPCC